MYRSIYYIFSLALIPWGETINVKRAVDLQQEACSVLENHEVYSSVKVAIGNPPQLFDLVADTGSDNCIVNDCSCKQCPKAWGSCFTEHSNSFRLPMFKVDTEDGGPIEAPASMIMRFGSGDISAEIASDQLEVGPVKVYMENGLLLMVDHALKLTGHFEGILGLGRPQESSQNPAREAADVHVPGFLDRANIRRFSICFNYKAPGVLGFNTPVHQNQLSSAGQAHWSLKFHSATLGQKNVDVGCAEGKKCSIVPDSGTTLIVGPENAVFDLFSELCLSWARCNEMYKKLQDEMSKESMQGMEIEGLEASRGLMSPPVGFMETVAKLAASSGESLNSSALPTTDTHRRVSALTSSESSAGVSNASFGVSPTMTLQLLLEHCHDWMEGVDINAEMPGLVFHVSDKNGKRQDLTISPRSYVLAKTVEVEVPGVRNIFGMHINTKQTQMQQMCVMAFSPANYQTALDGQIWILGMPLFYEYTAHYDRGSTPEQVTMGFTPRDEQACGKCDGNVISRAESLIAEQVKDSSRARVGVNSLNFLSKQPIIRDLSNIKQL